MLISEVFKPSNIMINLKSKNKKELFEELVDFLITVEHFTNKKEILNKLWKRELEMTTGISANVAIPHTNLDNMSNTIGIMGISKNGIEYGSLDSKPVHLVMLLLGNINNPTEHLNILKNIAFLLRKPDFYSKIMKCKTTLKINETIIEFEK